jgi:hypothetical protein
MGMIRGFFVVILSVLLFLSLFSVTLFGVLSSSLSYNHLSAQSIILIRGLLETNGMTDSIASSYPVLQNYCQTSGNSDYVFSAQEYTIDIPCDKVFEGTDAVLNESIKSVFHNIYYAKYECDFLDCFKISQVPLFLLSEKAYTFCNNYLYVSLALSFILSVLVFIFIEKKTNIFILVGSLLIIPSVLFIKLDALLSLFADKSIFKILLIFFSESFSVSLGLLITGIILVLIGIILKIFKLGFKIEEFISKITKDKFAPKKKPAQKPVKKQIVQKLIKKKSK